METGIAGVEMEKQVDWRYFWMSKLLGPAKALSLGRGDLTGCSGSLTFKTEDNYL